MAFFGKMSATSFRSTESENELVLMSSVSSFNEDIELPEFENTTGKSKASHWKPVVVMFLLILVLSLIIGLAIEANTTSKETQFISTSTLFYNMTVPPAKPITTTPETSFCGDQVWISDGQCDDESNKIDCQYDGGDCCLPNATLAFCMKCICHLTGHRHDPVTKESKEEAALVIIGGRLIESSIEDRIIFFLSSIENGLFFSIGLFELPNPNQSLSTFGNANRNAER